MSDRKRTTLSFEPLYSAPLIGAELRIRKRRKEQAALRKMVEQAIVAFHGPRHPKLLNGVDLNRVFGPGKVPKELQASR